MQWTRPILLQNYPQAPDDRGGVYEIGFWRGNNYDAKYLGKADSSIRDRLSSHYNLTGNRHITEYLVEMRFLSKLKDEGKLKDGVVSSKRHLWARWSRVGNPKDQEIQFMKRWEYEWNRRTEREPE